MNSVSAYSIEKKFSHQSNDPTGSFEKSILSQNMMPRLRPSPTISAEPGTQVNISRDSQGEHIQAVVDPRYRRIPAEISQAEGVLLSENKKYTVPSGFRPKIQFRTAQGVGMQINALGRPSDKINVFAYPLRPPQNVDESIFTHGENDILTLGVNGKGELEIARMRVIDGIIQKVHVMDSDRGLSEVNQSASEMGIQIVNNMVRLPDGAQAWPPHRSDDPASPPYSPYDPSIASLDATEVSSDRGGNDYFGAGREQRASSPSPSSNGSIHDDTISQRRVSPPREARFQSRYSA